MSVLSIDNISYTYSGTTKKVLNNANASFDAGKLYCIMGKSGAGKSTLLSLISGLDYCTSGKIYYNGKDLRKINRDDYRAKNIGVIFQAYNLILTSTALENIILAMQISGSKEKNKKSAAYQFLEKVGIDKETAERKILKLSGGEQQRVGISRALSHNPDVIIADEPTGNLDPDTEKEVMSLLQELAHNENKCVIVVTHSKQVSKFADEILILNRGTLNN